MPSSSYETLTRRFVDALFPHIHWQERVRPTWLRNPVTGNKLELDFFSSSHKVAIETQGPHHYRSVQGLASADKSQEQQQRDTFKRHKCTDAGVKLYTVSIFDMTLPRLYQLYRGMHDQLGKDRLPMIYAKFVGIRELHEIATEADRLSKRRPKPFVEKPPKRKGGIIAFLGRLFTRR